MSHYENSKKPRRIASIFYLLIMVFIFGGTYLSNKQKESTKKESSKALEASAVLSGTKSQN
ncbi:MAG: hypothetical protein ACO294_01100 [Methylococcales bacterium]